MILTLVSPHRDDAAFSCGILLSLCAAINVEIQVVNVFTQSDYAPFAEPSDVNRVSELRKGEDARLQTLVGRSLNFCDLGLEDAPLRFKIPAEQTLKNPIGQSVYLKEVEDLEEVLRPILMRADCVVLPLALGGHIDHRIVRDASISCVPWEAAAFYEDLPYAASTDADERTKVIAELDSPSKLQPITVRSSDGAAVKKAFASCYDSQVASSTVTEMVAYAEKQDGGETLYAGEEAARFLTRVVRFVNQGLLKT